MKKLLALGLLSLYSFTYSQIGINTTTPETTLDIRSKNHLGTANSNDGILIPGVTNLNSDGNAEGQLIYLSKNIPGKTKGFYFWNSTESAWKKIINSNAITDESNDAWENDPNNSRIALSTLSDGNSPRSESANIYIYDQGKIGIGNAQPVLKVDTRSNIGGTAQEGSIAIGNTSLSASQAGAGAIRYNSTTKDLEFSNGSTWNHVNSVTHKSIVVAKKITNQSFSNKSTLPIPTTGWNSETDINSDFNATTGEFKAPRDGNYIVSFNFNFKSKSINAGTQVEAILLVSNPGDRSLDRKSIITYPNGGTVQGGSSINFVIPLKKNQIVRPAIWHNTGSSQELRVLQNQTPNNTSDDGFVTFSATEL